MLSRVALLLCTTVLSAGVHGYPHGVPGEACQSMYPLHNKSENTGPAPYSVQVSQTMYDVGQTVNVTIFVQNFTAMPMEGFFLMALLKEGNKPFGSFTLLPQGTRSACFSGVSHNSKEKQDTLSFTWTPPSPSDQQPLGDVYFKATVVRGWSGGFWTGLVSDTVRAPAAPPTTGMPTCVAPPAQQTVGVANLLAVISVTQLFTAWRAFL